ncbi:MAG: rod-binding protein, partial [Atribacterota bacterium]|nr:rod-binding protein [Atribacterota bacterium]
VKTMKVALVQGTTSREEAKTEKRLRSACEDFEAFLLSFMFKRAFQPVFGSSLFSSQEEAWFREMWVEEVAKGVARQGGVGIARILFQELMREKT